MKKNSENKGKFYFLAEYSDNKESLNQNKYAKQKFFNSDLEIDIKVFNEKINSQSNEEAFYDNIIKLDIILNENSFEKKYMLNSNNDDINENKINKFQSTEENPKSLDENNYSFFCKEFHKENNFYSSFDTKKNIIHNHRSYSVAFNLLSKFNFNFRKIE